jgi:hypothetical protein
MHQIGFPVLINACTFLYHKIVNSLGFNICVLEEKELKMWLRRGQHSMNSKRTETEIVWMSPPLQQIHADITDSSDVTNYLNYVQRTAEF